MKRVEFSLLEKVGDCADRLISAHSSLRSFVQDLPTEHLVPFTASGQSESAKPVSPPGEFVLEVKRVVSHRAWKQLKTLLEQWHSNYESQDEDRLNLQEHEYLTMQLLWQTLLVTECKRRHEAIQRELTAIRT